MKLNTIKLKSLKSALTAAVCCCSVNNAMAHSQTPSTLEKLTASGTAIVYLEIGNLNPNRPMSYDIFIDSIRKGSTPTLNPKEFSRFKFILTNAEPNTSKVFKVCSVSNQKPINTRICSAVSVEYIQQ